MAEKKERVLPEVLEHDFIICDESVNRYGWRLLVAGIGLVGFLKNPVCCVQHYTNAIPVGKWKNLRVEGSEFKGTVEFDRNDEEAVKLYWKYKDGYMSAVSLNVIPIEESEDSKLLLPGQKCATLVKSELIEISCVTIPGQANAVKLSTPEGKEYKLNLLTENKSMAKEEKTVEQLSQELEAQKKLNADNLITIHKNRGVVADGEIDSLKKLALADYDATSTMLLAREVPKVEKSETNAETLADALVKLHFDRGAITEGEKAIFKGAATLDYEGTKKVLEAKTGKDGLQTFVQGMTQGANSPTPIGSDERVGWGYYEYFTKDPQALALIEKNEPEKFKKLQLDFQGSVTESGTLL